VKLYYSGEKWLIEPKFSIKNKKQKNARIQSSGLSSLLCSFLHFPVTSSFLDPNIPLSTLFSNTLSLLSVKNTTMEKALREPVGRLK
jgi:hypothetical protein